MFIFLSKSHLFFSVILLLLLLIIILILSALISELPSTAFCKVARIRTAASDTQMSFSMKSSVEDSFSWLSPENCCHICNNCNHLQVATADKHLLAVMQCVFQTQLFSVSLLVIPHMS